MNKKTLRIAEELVKTAEDLIFADSDYIYDPDHKKKPSGGYHKTEKGWSKKEEKKEKSTSSPKVEMTDEQKKLDEMANDEDYEVRYEVAKNKKTSPKTLDKLADDEDEMIRYYVAEHPNTSPKTLDKLSNDENYEVRSEVAKNPKTPIETLEQISKADKTNSGPGQSARFNLYNRKNEVGQKNWQNSGFDLSKLSPELRGKIEYWDAEDIKKFIAWLKEHKG